MMLVVLVIGAVFLLILGIGVVLAFNRFRQTVDYRLLTTLRKAAVVPIASVKDSAFEKISGTVELAKPLIRAPISKRECVCYRVRVEEEVVITDADMSTSRTWKTIVDESDQIDFYVRDDSGRALVRVEGADSLFDWDESYGDSTYETMDTTPEYAAFCQRHGLDGTKQTLRCFEGVLEVGERAHVQGTVEKGRDEREPIVLRKRGESPLYVADADKFEKYRDKEPGPMGL